MKSKRNKNFFSNLIFTSPLLIRGGLREGGILRLTAIFILPIYFIFSLVVIINRTGFSIKNFFATIACIIIYLLIVFSTFDFNKIKYAWNYLDSEWYQTSNLTPKETASDKGESGEYWAIYEIKRKYEKTGVPFKLYCSLVIPKKYMSSEWGAHKALVDFSEIDCLVLSPCGCDVFEIKNRAGVFSGATGGDRWYQEIGSQVHELENPLKQNNKHIQVLDQYIKEARPNKRHNIDATPIYRNIVFYANSDASFNFGLPEYINYSPEYTWQVVNLTSFHNDFTCGSSNDNRNSFWTNDLLFIFEEVLDHTRVYNHEELRYLLSARQLYYDKLRKI